MCSAVVRSALRATRELTAAKISLASPRLTSSCCTKSRAVSRSTSYELLSFFDSRRNTVLSFSPHRLSERSPDVDTMPSGPGARARALCPLCPRQKLSIWNPDSGCKFICR